MKILNHNLLEVNNFKIQNNQNKILINNKNVKLSLLKNNKNLLSI